MATDFQDTQLMPSQVYHNYYREQEQSRVQIAGDPRENRGAYATGDTGHVDLLQGFESQNGEAGNQYPASGDLQVTDHSDNGEEADEPSEDELAQPERAPTTSPSGFEPITPAAIAGQKHSRSGNIITSVEKTPAPDYTAMFPNGLAQGQPGLSQIFHQTQADSSPGSPNNLRSDPIFERPSPAFRGVLSTPALATSSPVLTRYRDYPRPCTEPRDAYLPVDESQRERDRHRLRNMHSSPVSDFENDDWENDIEQRRARARRIRERTMKSFADIEASGRKQTHNLRPAATVIPLPVVPATRQRPFIISSGSHDAGGDQDDSDQNVSHDEYDELSQAIITSDKDTDWSSSKNPQKQKQLQRPHSSPLPASAPLSDSSPCLMAPFENNLPPRQGSEVPHRPDADRDAQFVPNSQLPLSQTHRMPRPHDPSSISSSHMFVSDSPTSFVPSLTSSIKATMVGVPAKDSVAITSSLPHGPLINSSQPEAYTVPNERSLSPLHRRTRLRRPQEHKDGQLEPGEATAMANSRSSQNPESRTVQKLSSNRGSFLRSDAANSQNVPVNNHGLQPIDSDQAVPETSPAATAVSHRPLGELDGGTADNIDRPESPQSTRSSQKLSASLVRPPSTAQYQTAHPQPISSPLIPLKTTPLRPQSSIAQKSPTLSPSQHSNIRPLTDIAGEPSPQKSSYPVDPGIFNIMNEDDERFHNTIAGLSDGMRPTKRPRRVYRASRTKQALSALHDNTENASPPVTMGSAKAAPNVVPRPRNDDQPDELQGPYSSPLPQPQRPARTPRLTNLQSSAGPVANGAEVKETPQTIDKMSQMVTRGHTEQRNRANLKRAGAKSTHHDDPTNDIDGDESHHRSSALDTTFTKEHNNSSEEIVLNRILALFKGLKQAFYPATCLGLTQGSNSTYRVRFDDDTEDDIESHLVKPLDLRLGDEVKVDANGMRTKVYRIAGFKDKVSPNEATNAAAVNVKADIRGFRTVLVVPKQRTNLPQPSPKDAAQAVSVSIADLYVTNTLWPRFEARSKDSCLAPLEPDRLRTPIDGAASTPTSPASRIRRHAANNDRAPALTAAQQTFPRKSGLFSNMAFALSYSASKDHERAAIAESMQENGGHVLAEGFDCLFEPTSCMNSQHSKDLESPTDLVPASSMSSLGFVALISDTHSRRQKYMQALALNLPCLSGRWITDCIRQERVLPWDPYLLPAGESALLDGVIRSRTSVDTTIDAKEYSFASQVQHRPKLLNQQRVLLVMSNAKADNRRNAYIFLTRALGASRVEKVKDLASCKSKLDDDNGTPWNIICVEDSRVEEATAKLSMGQYYGRLKESKRRRARDEHEDELGETSHDFKAPRIIGDEAIVQSLIAGQWYET